MRPRTQQILISLLLLCTALPLLADGMSATVIVPDTNLIVGDQVELRLRLQGINQISHAPSIEVAGLTVELAGSQNNVTMENGRVNTSIDIVYSLRPDQPGDFVIPALDVHAGTQVIKTQPVALKVARDSGEQRPETELAFATITTTRAAAYLGELIPVQLTLYIDENASPHIQNMPDLQGDGFTKQRFPQPQEKRQTKNGRGYRVLTFTTAIAATRAGKVTIGPSEIPMTVVTTARRGQKRGRSLIEEMFGSDPFSSRVQKELKVVAPALELMIRNVPTEGRPESYKGAVGEFTMVATAMPNRLKLGDPLTVEMAISGTGNFDRVEAPVLSEPEGWQTYPPASSFEAGDQWNYRGTKKFEMAVVPLVAKNTTPVVEFSFFNPAKDAFETLRSHPSPLVVEGAPTPAPRAMAGPASGNSNGNAGAASAFPGESDSGANIPQGLGLKTDFGMLASFAPTYTQSGFWWFQLFPFAALAAATAVRLLRKDEKAKRLDALKKDRAAKWQAMEAAGTCSDLFEAAFRWLQLDTAVYALSQKMPMDRDPSTLDVDLIHGIRRLKGASLDALHELAEARSAYVYSAGRDPKPTDTELGKARQLLQTITS